MTKKELFELLKDSPDNFQVKCFDMDKIEWTPVHSVHVWHDEDKQDIYLYNHTEK
jgi:hypothetical protein